MNRCGWILVATLCALCLHAGCRHAPRPSGSLVTRTALPSGTLPADAASRGSAPAEDRVPAVRTVSTTTHAQVPSGSERPDVVLASATVPVAQETTPPDYATDTLEELPTPDSVRAAGPLDLAQIINSVYQSYPLLKVAFLERGIADGEQLAAWGEFDTSLKAFAIEMPEGYYENYRQGVALTQPTFQGGYVFGAYKIGRGRFQPWFKERQTNDGGEFAVGAGLPLLKDRAIDKRRSELFQADLTRQAVEPAIQTELLEYVRIASQVYWTWIAAGQVVDARRELLRLARSRVQQIDDRIAAGDLGQIARINNEQLIAARETKLIEAERKLQMTAIKLSLFYRAPGGRPVVPGTGQLPQSFPDHAVILDAQINRDIDMALAARPELVELDMLSQKAGVELSQAENMLLPKLDALVIASKDTGAAAEKIDNKGPFELEAGLYGEVPLQRREAAGKIETIRAKLAQLRAKREFVANKIVAEVQDSVSALQAAEARIDRAGTNLQLADETLRLGRVQFDAGDIDLVELNIYEQASMDARVLRIDAEVDFFIALADYRAALGSDPLQSVTGR